MGQAVDGTCSGLPALSCLFIWVPSPSPKRGEELEGGRLQVVGAREPLGVGPGLLCVLCGALALMGGRSAP